MKRILRNSIVLFTILIAVIFSTSCTNRNKIAPCKSTKFRVVSIKSPSLKEQTITTNFIMQNPVFFTKLKKFNTFKSTEISSKTRVIKYSNLSGKAIVVDFNKQKLSLKNQQSSDTLHSLILLLDKKNAILGNIEYTKIISHDYYLIKTYVNGKGWFNAKVDNGSNKIEYVNFLENNDKNKSFKSGNMSFEDCVKMAVNSCLNDPVCAFECGLVAEECLGAIALACLYEAI